MERCLDDAKEVPLVLLLFVFFPFAKKGNIIIYAFTPPVIILPVTSGLHLETKGNLFIYRVAVVAKTDRHGSKQDGTPAGGDQLSQPPT